ncbi:fungal specific transcription factor domain-containing protein [Aspergillus affinis]|uniref:fungal specific transcription factor domain-containing protein n=1 Tax=Aspergillus affinis TaxID=1070780 RepID=UPI0022FE9AD6|nr:fungal-specific transcription factor domain-containing protein [Aspergillus affinis]KAI9042354.1 fungal-specific transcription factor domain-containing protein [Aspergillus affinis]
MLSPSSTPREAQCRNCQKRGGDCDRSSARDEILTVPRAAREIERLTKRVRELEAQVEAQKLQNPAAAEQPTSQQPTPHNASLDPLQGHGGARLRWEGVHTRSAKLDQTHLYLGSVFGQPTSEYYMQPNSASRSFASPSSAHPDKASALRESGQAIDDLPEDPTGDYLTEIQEDYFPSLYWHSYHCTYQILDETEFRQHYRSLRSGSGPRRPSALVDIVLALCMQYGVSFLSRSETDGFKTDVDSTDATIAGRALYRRSQTLLKNEQESPSIVTLQCHMFTVVYICNASFQNMAHNLLALAVRTAQILGLHLEPPEDLPRQ